MLEKAVQVMHDVFPKFILNRNLQVGLDIKIKESGIRIFLQWNLLQIFHGLFCKNNARLAFAKGHQI